MVGSMIEPKLFDIVELLVDLPESNLRLGARGAIVDCYSDGNYEVEFSDRTLIPHKRSLLVQQRL